MRAQMGDRLVVRGATVGQPDRNGTIVDVRGSGGEPPYVVRFDDGSEHLIFPGSDAVVQPRRALDDEL